MPKAELVYTEIMREFWTFIFLSAFMLNTASSHARGNNCVHNEVDVSNKAALHHHGAVDSHSKMSLDSAEMPCPHANVANVTENEQCERMCFCAHGACSTAFLETLSNSWISLVQTFKVLFHTTADSSLSPDYSPLERPPKTHS